MKIKIIKKRSTELLSRLFDFLAEFIERQRDMDQKIDYLIRRDRNGNHH